MEAHLLETVTRKEEEGGGGAAHVERKVVVATGGVARGRNHLDLRLGISLNGFGDVQGRGGGTTTGGPSGSKGAGGHVLAGAATAGSFCVGGVVAPQQPARVCSGALGAKRWFSETTAVGSFVDPWSLAARQESAVLEQRTIAFRRNVDPTAPSHTVIVPRAPLPSPVVGWPPVRAFRKNLVTPLHPNPEMDVKKDPNKKTKSSEEDTPTKLDTKSTMFVKVNMEGCNVGRKIDLMAHGSYQSLSCALQKMFHNFLTVGYSNNTNPDAQVELISTNYILLYEDNEGDKLLVGDVPWEMFLGSVKRLYIANGSKDPKTAEERAVGNNKSKQFEVEVKAKG